MSSRVRKIFFVCVAISLSGDLITKLISAVTPEDAGKLFLEEFNIAPKEILGPFYKKRTQVIENTRILKFASNMQSVKAIYDNWLVNAFVLKEPENHAYLIFIKREDDVQSTIPKGTIVVPINNLRFI